MKCFVAILAVLAAARADSEAEADPQFLYQGGFFNGHLPYFGGYAHAYKTVTPLAHPHVAAVAVAGSPFIGLRAAVPAVPGIPVGPAPFLRAAVPAVPAAFAAPAPIAPVAAPLAAAPLAAAPLAAPAPAIAGPAPLAGPAPVLNAAPAAIAAAPVAPAPAVPVAALTSSQYHAQDELGNYEFGYQNANSAKRERGNSAVGVEGSYSYVDSNGIPQQVNYAADDFGFRATGTNFPNTAATALGRRKRQVLALDAPALPYPALPAFATPLAAPAAIAAPAPIATPLAAPGVIAAPAPLAAPLAYNTISAPAARQGILTRIQNNPGHAVSYRVD